MAFICNQIEPSSTSDLLTKFTAELVDMGWALHDAYIPFTSGGTHEVLVGDTLTGATSGATGVVGDIVVTGGTWGAGSAAGFFGLTTITGQFSSAGENLNEGVNGNVCTVNGYYYEVYKSNGEDADRTYEYISLVLIGVQIGISAYGWWNSSTHTGNTSGVAGITYSKIEYVSGMKLVVSGNKNLVVTHRIGYTSNVTYDMMFGHIPKRFYAAPLATLTDAVTPGDGKTVLLDNTTKFIPNQTYWIVGVAGESRDRIKVTSVNPGVSITGDGLTIGFAAGAKVGAMPSTFIQQYTGSGVIGSSSNPTFARIVGTGSNGETLTVLPIVAATYVDPDLSLGYLGAPLNTLGLYVLQPIIWAKLNEFPVGYTDEYVKYPPITTNDTIWGVTSDGKPLDTGTATDGSSVTLTCAGKSWGVDAYADKSVYIDSGTGAGYSRRIVSNTAEILTVNKQWDVTPNTTSIFYIVDEVYRSISSLNIAYREYI